MSLTSSNSISTPAQTKPRPAIPIGDHVLDLAVFTAGNGFAKLSIVQPHQTVFSEPTLNSFAALGRPIHSVVRKYIQSVFLEDGPYPEILKENSSLQRDALVPLKDVHNHLPLTIGDYTDFFVGRNHAYNCGVIFRDAANALAPNYNHLPVGYHGRASSIVVSGTDVRRPHGQMLDQNKKPIQGPCQKLDFELEMAAFICKPNPMGEPVPVDDAEESIFGLVLMNDWSARDIQMWESNPLGPFNGKNFGTSISPWVILPDALQPFEATGLDPQVERLPYLAERKEKNMYDIRLAVSVAPKGGKPTEVCHSSMKYLLFSFPQMLAHHTRGGCPMRVGDMIASGTISGTTKDECGCLLERTENGKLSVQIDGGQERLFLHDGDVVTLSGVAGSEETGLVGFGECSGSVLPALKL